MSKTFYIFFSAVTIFILSTTIVSIREYFKLKKTDIINQLQLKSQVGRFAIETSKKCPNKKTIKELVKLLEDFGQIKTKDAEIKITDFVAINEVEEEIRDLKAQQTSDEKRLKALETKLKNLKNVEKTFQQYVDNFDIEDFVLKLNENENAAANKIMNFILEISSNDSAVAFFYLNAAKAEINLFSDNLLNAAYCKEAASIMEEYFTLFEIIKREKNSNLKNNIQNLNERYNKAMSQTAFERINKVLNENVKNLRNLNIEVSEETTKMAEETSMIAKSFIKAVFEKCDFGIETKFEAKKDHSNYFITGIIIAMACVSTFIFKTSYAEPKYEKPIKEYLLHIEDSSTGYVLEACPDVLIVKGVFNESVKAMETFYLNEENVFVAGHLIEGVEKASTENAYYSNSGKMGNEFCLKHEIIQEYSQVLGVYPVYDATQPQLIDIPNEVVTVEYFNEVGDYVCHPAKLNSYGGLTATESYTSTAPVLFSKGWSGTPVFVEVNGTKYIYGVIRAGKLSEDGTTKEVIVTKVTDYFM